MVKSTRKLRALGSRHSFNTIADSTAAQISLKHLDTMELDTARRRPSPSEQVFVTARLRPISTSRASHCTISPRCRTSPSPARLPRRPTDRASRTAICPPPSPPWKSSLPTGSSFTSHALRMRDKFLAGRRQPRRARRDHQGHARRRAHLPGEAGRLRKPVRWTSWSTISMTSCRAATASASSPTGRTSGSTRSGSSAASTRGIRSTEPDFHGATSPRRKLHPARRPLGRELHGADGRSRPLVRAPAPLPHELHPQQRRETAERILRPARDAATRPSSRSNAAGPITPHLFITEIPHHRRRRSLDEPVLRAGLHGHPLHLETGDWRGR